MAPHPVINYELAVNLTSKIPHNKNGVVVDFNVQANGKKQCQELVTEKSSTFASSVDVKENPTPHWEVHRQECTTNSNCKNQDCSTLCGPTGDREVTGHFTSNSNPPLEPGKTTHNASPTKLDNSKGLQTFVAYIDSHDTPVTKTHVAGTNKLNTEAQFRKIVTDNEDKK